MWKQARARHTRNHALPSNTRCSSSGARTSNCMARTRRKSGWCNGRPAPGCCLRVLRERTCGLLRDMLLLHVRIISSSPSPMNALLQDTRAFSELMGSSTKEVSTHIRHSCVLACAHLRTMHARVGDHRLRDGRLGFYCAGAPPRANTKLCSKHCFGAVQKVTLAHACARA